MNLHMLQLHPDPRALVRFLVSQGLNDAGDGDLGYGIHAWLKATFGDLAPAPFRLRLDSRQLKPPKLLAYTQQCRDRLLDQALTFAEPTARAVCALEKDLAVAELPGPECWLAGRRLGFEVLACPVARKTGTGVERDIFLHHADRASADTGLNRAKIYGDWLGGQLDGAARLDQVELAGFRLARQLRRGRHDDWDGRKNNRLTRPAALLQGVLEVRDGAAFHGRLARGIGRHRAFGYGMLLLRPA